MNDQLEFTIALDQDGTRYLPGSEVRGTVELRGPQEGWTADYADLILFWRTEGRGDRDEGIAAVMNLARTRGERMPPVTERSFSFLLPEVPWTWHGRLIKIHWYLGAYARTSLPLKLDAKQELPLIVHPDPERFEEEIPLP